MRTVLHNVGSLEMKLKVFPLAIGALLIQTACGVRRYCGGYNSQLAIQGTTHCHLVLPFQNRIINERETQREVPCPEHPNCAVCRKHKSQ